MGSWPGGAWSCGARGGSWPSRACTCGAGRGDNIEINLADGKCLDVPGSNFSSGVLVQEYSCNGTTAQKWDIVYVTSKYFQVRSAGNRNLCLNNWTGTAKEGGDIRLHTCASTDSWFNQVDPDWNGYLRFQPKVALATCVTAAGGPAQSAPMRLGLCGGASYSSYFDLFNVVYSEN
ncbi:RICIN domain-containing protein [Streptomyces sp. NBC_00090]|uniref:RICIN domain-containing protein n=1 Tax=Streptomyces sp. NBC_00090 TaxID=2903619 RepID=UPI00324BEAB5